MISLRLDGAYYGKDAMDIESFIHESKYGTKTLGELTEIRGSESIYESLDVG